MPTDFDVIVVGLGAMGSAAAFHLARAGRRVLGMDRFTPPHEFGSAHGQTRIIREAYFEHPLYVPLVQRAYELWAELEKETGRPLFRQTGGLMIGPPDGVIVPGARRSATEHRLPHEMLSAEETRRRFPVLRPADSMVAVWEPRAGVLFLEPCIEAHLQLARRHGAELHFGETVMRWQAEGAGVRVFTAQNEFRADRLILTAGAWIQSLLPDFDFPFRVERQILFWFEPASDREAFQPERCPVHIWEFEPGRFFYGFPNLGHGVKVARHHEGEPARPEAPRREVAPEEVDGMRRLVERFLPGAAGPLLASSVCLYTNTPDEHFFLDEHPVHPQVLIASPCSGHGFKFSSVIGEVLCELITTGRSRFDLSLFRRRTF